MKVAIIQKVITHYRRSIFDEIAQSFDLTVFAAGDMPSMALNVLDPATLSYGSRISMARHRGMLHLDLPALDAFDVVVSEYGSHLSHCYKIAWARRVGRIKRLAFWTHGPALHLRPGSIKRAGSELVRGLAFSQADALFLYTRSGEEWARAAYSSKLLYRIENTLAVAPQSRRPDSEKAQTIDIVSVSRLIPNKNIEFLIRSLAHLNGTSDKAFRLHIIGDGPEGETLEALVKSLGLENVTFLGALYGAELDRYLNACDVYALGGAAGLSVNQALLAGLPVVAFAPGLEPPHHHPEIDYIHDGVNGVLVKDRSIQAFGDAIQTVAENLPAYFENVEKMQHEIDVSTMVANLRDAIRGTALGPRQRG